MGLLKRLFGRSKPSDSFPPDEKVQEESRAGTEPEQVREAEDDYSEEIRLQVGNIQGVGDREQQEDSFAVLNSADPERQRSQGLLAMVADGMGGMADGKAASQLTVDVFLDRFSRWDGQLTPPEWLYGGAFAASDQVFSRSQGASGTTLIAVHIRENQMYWLSVGDSAIFLKRGEGVFQLNREHTYLNQLYARELEEETIDKDRAQNDADARRLTSFVGIDHLKEVDLNLKPWILKPGDVILLCSDGISGVLSPPELLEAMSLTPDEGCALLETMVLEKQIPEQDNYTGVMIVC
ncbi:MAG TPA: serine/threonine-protein phosphatase [Candidatus Enterocloster excrementigallinarum]|uniref:Serine/threonine-protein phosphatase n=1 Tax=Candidatus Enterocloster excrementigallinarum TaxID=2838558 RepID=A0A9D2PUU5_9FIRM|nr:serine/threonine-protein phosphatase [Candidatus Enterocloster excrementigallinarum]